LRRESYRFQQQPAPLKDMTMTKNKPLTPSNSNERAGPVRDFAAFSELERRRRSEENFDDDHQ